MMSPPSTAPAARLPFFEAALARSRGHIPGDTAQESTQAQPLPAYLPPADPNHPSLMIGMNRAETIRPVADMSHYPDRGLSRSPSPQYGTQLDIGNVSYMDNGDSEKALLNDYGYHDDWQYGDDEKDPALYDTVMDGDISEMPFGAAPFGPDVKQSQGMNQSSTQHFGPAPTGRVGRRTHNAAGPRRIKQTATLDQSGFFAVDMPIPTRLAQFLPVKGVEEQKSTRRVTSVHTQEKC